MKWQDSLQLKVDSKEQSAPTRFDINHNRPSCATQLVLKSSEKYKERSSDSSLSKNSISFMLPARTSKDDKDNSQTNSNVLEGVTTQNNVYQKLKRVCQEQKIGQDITTKIVREVDEFLREITQKIQTFKKSLTLYTPPLNQKVIADINKLIQQKLKRMLSQSEKDSPGENISKRTKNNDQIGKQTTLNQQIIKEAHANSPVKIDVTKSKIMFFKSSRVQQKNTFGKIKQTYVKVNSLLECDTQQHAMKNHNSTMLTKSGKAIALDQENCMKIDVKLSSSQNITSKKLEKSVKQLSASQGMHSIKTDRTRLKVSASQQRIKFQQAFYNISKLLHGNGQSLGIQKQTLGV